MIKNIIPKLVLIVLGICFICTAPLSAQATLTKDIDELVDWMEAYGFSGVVGAADGEDRVVASAGIANPLTGKEFKRSTPFDIASVTKHMTALVILSLVQDERIDLSAPVSRYLPDVKGPAGQISIQTLLNHTSGLPKDAKPAGTSLSYPDGLIKTLNTIEPKSAPGETFKYSNIGYCTLGLVAERVTRRSWARLLRQKLFTPATVDATLYKPESNHSKRLSIGVEGDKPVDPYAWTGMPLHQCGAAGVVMSAPTLLNWLNSLSNPDGPLADLVSVMRLSIGAAAAQKHPYGSGIRISDLGFGPALWHDGDTSSHEVFAARGLYTPYSLVFLSNSRLGWRNTFKETVFALAKGKALNLPPEPINCKTCEDVYKAEGVVIEFDGLEGVAKLSAPETITLFTPSMLAETTKQETLMRRATGLADAVLNKDKVALTRYIDPVEEADERLKKIGAALGFHPSAAQALFVTPWRPGIYQTHVAFKSPAGEQAYLRFVWHPKTEKLMFVGSDQQGHISLPIRRVAENEATVLNLRTKQWRTLQLSPLKPLSDWQGLVEEEAIK